MSAQPAIIGQPLTIPCTTWCTYQDHKDENCIGPERRVLLSLHPRDQYSNGEWGDDYAVAYAFRSRVDRDQYVHLGQGEAAGMQLTPAEARQVAAALIEAASELESEAAR